MPRYSEQFKCDAVALYENNEDLSLHAASTQLGINRASLHSWVKKYGTGKRARIKAVVKSEKVVYLSFLNQWARAVLVSGTGTG